MGIRYTYLILSDISVSEIKVEKWVVFLPIFQARMPPGLTILMSSLKAWGTMEPGNIPAEHSITSYVLSSMGVFSSGVT